MILLSMLKTVVLYYIFVETLTFIIKDSSIIRKSKLTEILVF